jgi:hypothetical protein
MSGENQNSIGSPDWISKLLATIDAISGYTYAALTVAVGVALWGPSPFLGIELKALRQQWGPWLLVAMFAFLCLTVAKVARWIHGAVARTASARAVRREAAAELRQKQDAEEAAREKRSEQIVRRCQSLSQGEMMLLAYLLLENRQSITMPMTNPHAQQLAHKGLLAQGGGRPTGLVFTVPDDAWEYLKGIRETFIPPKRDNSWELDLRSWIRDQCDWLSS